MELTISAVLLGVLTLLVGAVGYLVLFRPGKKEKEEALKEMAFDDIIDNDAGWAEEEESEKKAKAAAAAAAVPKAAAMPPTLPPPNSHDPNLPFQIGDRVTLQKLVGAAVLNGRHGVIAAPYDKKTQRYPVDLDLSHDKPLAVKEGNLLNEPATTPCKDQPAIVKGCLEPAHAKACGFIFHVMRKSLSTTLKGETNGFKLAVWGWLHWLGPNGDKTSGVYPSLLQYLTKDILKTQKLTDLDTQVSPDPKEPTAGAYQLVTKAMRSPQAVAAWNVRIEGSFWIVGMGPTGTMVVPCNNTRQVYMVAGFQAPLMAVAGGGQTKFPRPPKFHLIILPWFGVLVHDPFLCPTTGTNQVELASPQLTQELVMNSKRAVAENRIITGLHQLQMEPPNLQGVPFTPPPNVTVDNKAFQDPPTAEEKELIQKVASYKDLIPPPDGLWNFIHTAGGAFVVINAKGEQFANFSIGADRPMHIELLEQVVKMCKKRDKKERPAAMGVADEKVCQRMQFLCQSIPNMRILLLNIKKKEGAAKEPTAQAAE